MNELILLVAVGLPRSGKTTWARSVGAPIVNPDSIRLAIHGQRFITEAEPWVWAMAFAMVDALFRAGHSTVIADATNVSAKRRKQWEGLAARLGCRVQFQVFRVPAEECIRRARLLNDEEIVPVIERMAREWDLSCGDGCPGCPSCRRPSTGTSERAA